MEWNIVFKKRTRKGKAILFERNSKAGIVERNRNRKNKKQNFIERNKNTAVEKGGKMGQKRIFYFILWTCLFVNKL